jgi:hypothetical protein
MKKIPKLLAIMPALFIMLSGGAVLAQSQSCTLTGTGPGSNNVCQFDVQDNVIYTCINNVLVVNGTNQTAISGGAQNSSNTSSGSVTSGSAINSGQLTTNANATCAAATVTQPTPQTQPTPKPPVATRPTTAVAAPTAKNTPQVEVPKGGVNAGGGGGIGGGFSALAAGGLIGSLGLIALGWRLRKSEI